MHLYMKKKILYLVLPLVTFVKWDQGQCSAPSGEIGNCIPATECQLRGGIAGGQCAGGMLKKKTNKKIFNYEKKQCS